MLKFKKCSLYNQDFLFKKNSIEVNYKKELKQHFQYSDILQFFSRNKGCVMLNFWQQNVPQPFLFFASQADMGFLNLYLHHIQKAG